MTKPRLELEFFQDVLEKPRAQEGPGGGLDEPCTECPNVKAGLGGEHSTGSSGPN